MKHNDNKNKNNKNLTTTIIIIIEKPFCSIITSSVSVWSNALDDVTTPDLKPSFYMIIIIFNIDFIKLFNINCSDYKDL
jgi:hypothetical protein